MKYRPTKEIRELPFDEMEKYYENNNKLTDNNPEFVSEYFGKENANLLEKDLLNFDFNSFPSYAEKVFSILWEMRCNGIIDPNALYNLLKNTTTAVNFLYELNMRMGNRINYLEEEIEKLKTK